MRLKLVNLMMGRLSVERICVDMLVKLFRGNAVLYSRLTVFIIIVRFQYKI